MKPRRDADEDSDRSTYSPAEAEALQRRKEQMNRSPQERQRLLQEAKTEFEKVYLGGPSRPGRPYPLVERMLRDQPLVDGPRLHRSHDAARPGAERTVIHVPVPDVAREAMLQSRIRELESQLAETQTRHVEPVPEPFNPVRVKTTRKLAVD